MMSNKLLAAFGVFALVAGVAVSPAHAVKGCAPAKNLTKGCKNEIKACVTAECASLATKKEKKQCARACRTEIVAACKESTTVCTGSASAAFLD